MVYASSSCVAPTLMDVELSQARWLWDSSG